MSSTTTTVALLTAIICMEMSAANAQQPSFVPGQVQLRFLEGTPQRETVVQVSQTTPLDLGGLDNVTEELSQRAGVPLRVHHLGSGYWLTFAVDPTRFSESITSILAAHEGVKDVVIAETEGSDLPGHYVVSPNPDSPLERTITRRSRRALMRLVSGWSSTVGLPLQYSVNDAHLEISVDWNAGTLDLIERIKGMPEVEAAQPNYRMGMGSPI